MRKGFSDIRNSKLFTADHIGLQPVGNVTDLLVEEGTWTVRYLVVSTDAPLTRQVLISPAAIQEFDHNQKSIATILTVPQVLGSPLLSSDQPISRQYEKALVDYYGWPIYWLGRAMMNPQTMESAAADDATDAIDESNGSSLRSANELCGYQIQSPNGPAGTMEDLVIQMDSWTVEFVTADSSTWLPKESSLVSTLRIFQIDWSSRTVMVDLSKAALEPVSAKHDFPAITGEPLLSRPFHTPGWTAR